MILVFREETVFLFYHLKIIQIEQDVMIKEPKLFDQPLKNDLRIYDNIQKIATGQGDDCTTGCLIDDPYSKEHYKIIAIDLSKQQVLDSDPKAIQQINFTENLERCGNTTIFFIKRIERNYFFHKDP